MIADRQTNTIYFSKLLSTNPKYSGTYNRILSNLKQFGLTPKLLDETKDIWARDYMPIQVNKDRYIQYRYEPNYLNDAYGQTIKSIPDAIMKSFKKEIVKTDIIIDGGNVVKSSNCVIMTDKIFKENPNRTKDRLAGELKELFLVDKIVIIPMDINEPTYGHSDGMVRFIDEKRVLYQGYFDGYNSDFKHGFFDELDRHGITPIPLKFDVEQEHKDNWAYLNFLQTKDLILIPELKNAEENQQALTQIRNHFPDYSYDRIIPISMDAVIRKGGALNCISWTIKE
ncbi:MAG TPA: agmatine deiminase family protein [Tenuifilaceae bacterium]|nr:agmatine deiminase family protein [Tenuifilaceae bacterium]